jgi:acyl carrier protein
MAITRDDLLSQFRRIATEVAERDIQITSETARISDLGLDSLNTLEIIGSLERELKVRIPDDQLVGIQTVGQLIDLVQKRLV